MAESFNILVNKLNRFRTKYYVFKVLKGFLFTLFILIFLFTVFSVVEYFLYLSSEVRKGFFYGFILFGSLLSLQFILLPLLRLIHILKPIDSKSSSKIIQKHFTDIKDKLLNVFELSEIKDSTGSKELLLASINQKIKELEFFDFGKAVQFKNLRLVLIYFILSISLVVLLFGLNKSIFVTAPNRIINYNVHYTKPAPYAFKLLNTNMNAVKGESYSIKMETVGEEVPQVAYINIEGNNYLMKSSSPGIFEFEMSSVINSVSFYFTDLKYNSNVYSLQLLPKPGINNFNVSITPPGYTGLPVQQFDNTGDLQVPEGSLVNWVFKGIDIDTLHLLLSDSIHLGAVQEQNNSFTVEKQFNKSANYHVFIKNELTEPELALSYFIDVVPDMYPEIKILRLQDSLRLTHFFFKGVIGDDYGFTNLKFHYTFNDIDSVITIPMLKQVIDQEFYFSFDFGLPDVAAGLVNYYFSVTDNDAVNGFKTTTSEYYTFRLPDKNEIAELEDEQFEQIESMLKESEQLAKDIQNDLQNLRIKNMDTNVSEWEKKQMINEIMSKQNKLEQVYDRIKEENKLLNNYMQSFNKKNEELIEKQKQIEALLEEVFTDELKSLLEEFQKLAEKFDSRKLNQLSDKMDYTYEDLQKQLDRNLEMLKKMKVEQQFQDVIDDINRLGDEEERMANDIIEKSNFDELSEQLNQHQNEFDNTQKSLEDAFDRNEELEKKLKFNDFKEQFDDIQKSMEDSKNLLQEHNKEKSESKLKDTSVKMKNTALAMQQMLDSNKQEQNLENLQNLRQILSNLVYLSFEQEKVLIELNNINSIDPSLNELNMTQKHIQDQSHVVKDSLYALAKRTPQINSMINNELLNMEFNLNKAIEEMNEGLYPNARSSQQFVMTSTNNLALLLNEALDNLEQQMADAQPGDQAGENSGQKKPGMNLLKEQSENIKQQLEQMIEQMKKGQSQNMNQQLGESLMQHEMMQQMLREIMNGGGLGNDSKNVLKEIDDILDQNRKQLMNKNVNSQMIARQNLIKTRLLDAEKSEMEREYEEKRESKTAEDFYSNPVQFFEYHEKRQSTVEYLNRNSHKLSNFYNNKYKHYLNNMQNGNSE